jgi:hypothetical protein
MGAEFLWIMAAGTGIRQCPESVKPVSCTVAAQFGPRPTTGLSRGPFRISGGTFGDENPIRPIRGPETAATLAGIGIQRKEPAGIRRDKPAK